jgi:hypothetical protein
MAELTAHRRQRVRRAAAAALGGIPSSESPRILTQLLRDALDADDALVALEAARSLGRLRQTRVEIPVEARTLLVDRLHSLPERDGWHEVICLGYLHDPDALPPLDELMHGLATGGWDRRRDLWRTHHLHRVLQAIADCGNADACDGIIAVRDGLPEDLQREADVTLIRLGDRRGLDHLVAKIRCRSSHAWANVRSLADSPCRGRSRRSRSSPQATTLCGAFKRRSR